MLKWLLKWFSAHPMAHVPDITVERAAEITKIAAVTRARSSLNAGLPVPPQIP
jgi:hypothetical protein